MGNEISSGDHTKKRVQIPSLFGAKKPKSILFLTPHKSLKPEDYIIGFNKDHTTNTDEHRLTEIDQKRTIFVSLIGLFQTWETTPSHILYSCIVILPLRQKWICKPRNYADEISTCFVSQISQFHADSEKFQKFIQFLRWKDSQKLVFYTLDDYSSKISDHGSPSKNVLISPFWKYFSQRLSSLYDPVTRQKYKPLIFDDKWWRTEFADNLSKFKVKPCNILSELYLLTMKFRAIQELIHQSNPDSFNVVKFYNQPQDNFISNSVKINLPKIGQDDIFNDGMFEDGDGEWFISTDYDPYDLHDNDIHDA